MFLLFSFPKKGHENMNNKKYDNSTLLDYFNFSSSTDFLTIPDSLITYARDTVFSTWQTIELQLSQVDPAKDPEMYQALDDRANTLFNAWVEFRYVGRKC